MKKIAIFGGSGNTGLCAVDAALKKGLYSWKNSILNVFSSLLSYAFHCATGLSVRALARDPSRFPEDVASKIEIVQGDVLNYEDVKKTVEGVDGAVIVLGTRNDVSK